MTSAAKAGGTRPGASVTMHVVYAYLIGLAACFISFSIAGRPSGRLNTLFAALLGLAGVTGEIFNVRGQIVPVVLAATALSGVFALAEVLRVRDSWLRWVGYALWVLLGVATLWWMPVPNI